MKILVIGSGGREHAICWKLCRSPKVSRVYAAPGNPGIALLGPKAATVDIAVDRIADLMTLAEQEKIDLTVVGPEYPLTRGIVDEFRAAKLRIAGPTRAAARIEGSKSFAKEIMQRAGAPTARAEVFDDPRALEKYL